MEWPYHDATAITLRDWKWEKLTEAEKSRVFMRLAENGMHRIALLREGYKMEGGRILSEKIGAPVYDAYLNSVPLTYSHNGIARDACAAYDYIGYYALGGFAGCCGVCILMHMNIYKSEPSRLSGRELLAFATAEAKNANYSRMVGYTANHQKWDTAHPTHLPTLARSGWTPLGPKVKNKRTSSNLTMWYKDL